MDWAASEWKQDLPAAAIQKINILEEQCDKLLKVNQQKQLQLDQMEQVVQKHKQKNDSHKDEVNQLTRELASSRTSYNECQSQLAKLKNDLLQRESKVNMLEQQLGKDRFEGAISNDDVKSNAVNPELFQLRKAVDQLQSENKALRAEKAKLESQTTSFHDTNFAEKIGTPCKPRQTMSSENQIDKVQREKGLIEDQVKTLESKLRQITQDLECQRHNFEASKSSQEMKFKERENGLREELKQQSQLVSDADKQLNELKSKLSQAQHQLSTMDSLKAALEKEKASNTSLSKEMQQNRDTYEVNMRTLTDTTSSQIDSLNKQLQIKENEIKELTVRVAESSNEILAKDKLISDLRNEIEDLKAQLAKFQSESSSLGKLKQDHLHDVERLKATISQLQNKHELDCNEMTAKDRRNCELEAQVEKLKQEIASLNQKVEDLESFEKLLAELKNKYLDSLNKLESRKLKINENAAEILRLREEISSKEQEANSRLEMTVAEKKAHEATIESLQASLESLREEKETLSHDLKCSKDARVQESEDNQALIKELKDKLESETIQTALLREDLELNQTGLIKILEKCTSLEDELNKLKNQFPDLMSRLNDALALEKPLKELKLKLSTVEAEKETLEQDIETYKQNQSVLELRVTELVAKIEDFEQREFSMKETISSLEAEQKVSEAKIADFIKNKEYLEQDQAELQQVVQSLELIKEENQVKISELLGMIELLEQNNEELQQFRNENLKSTRENECKMEELLSKIRQYEQELDTNQSMIQGYVSQINIYEEDKSTLQQTIQSLESNSFENEGRIQEYLSQIKFHEEEKATNQLELASLKSNLEAEVEVYLSRINFLEEEKVALQLTIKSLELNESKIQEQLLQINLDEEEKVKLQQTIDSLESKISELQSQVLLHVEEKVALHHSLESLESNQLENEARIADLLSKVQLNEQDNLKEEVERLRDELLKTSDELNESSLQVERLINQLDEQIKLRDDLSSEASLHQIEMDAKVAELVSKIEFNERTILDLQEKLQFSTKELEKANTMELEVALLREQLTVTSKKLAESLLQVEVLKDQLDEQIKSRDNLSLEASLRQSEKEAKIAELVSKIECNEQTILDLEEKLQISTKQLEDANTMELEMTLLREQLTVTSKKLAESLLKVDVLKDQLDEQIKSKDNLSLEASLRQSEKEAKIAELVYKIESNEQTILDLEEKLQFSTKQLEESNLMELEVAQLREQLTETSEKLTESDLQVQLLKDQMNEQLLLNRDLQENFASETLRYKDELQTKDNELQEILTRMGTTSNEVVRLQNELCDNLEKLDSFTAEIQEAKSELISLEEDNQNLRQTITEMESDIQSKQSDIEHAQSESTKLNEQLESIKLNLLEDKKKINEDQQIVLFEISRMTEELRLKENLVSNLTDQLNSSLHSISEYEAEQARLKRELEQLKEINETYSEIKSTLTEELKVKDDSLSKLEEEISTCLSSMVEKNNYINSLQASMSRVRAYFREGFSSKRICHEVMNNRTPDYTVLDYLMAELVDKNDALDGMKKLLDGKIAIIENKMKTIEEAECSTPLDESLMKINSLKAFFEQKLKDLLAMNEELDQMQGAMVVEDVVDDASCGDHAAPSTSALAKNLDVGCKDLEIFYGKLTNTLSSFEDNILRLKNGQNFEDPFEIELSKLRNEITAAEVSNANLIQSQAKFEGERLEFSSKLQHLELEVEKLKRDVKSKDEIVKQLSETIEEVEENLQVVYGEKSEAVEKVARLEKENCDQLEEIQRLTKNLDSLTIENLNKHEETAILEREIQYLELESDKEQLETRIKELEALLSEKEGTLSEQSEKLNSLNELSLKYEEEIGNLRLQCRNLKEELELARKYADEVVEELSQAEESLKASSDTKNKFIQMSYELDHLKECLKTMELRNADLESSLKNYESSQCEISSLNDCVKDLEAKLAESCVRETELATYKVKFEETNESLMDVRQLVEDLLNDKKEWLLKEAEFLNMQNELKIINSSKIDVEDSFKSLQEEIKVYELKLTELETKNNEKQNILREMEMKVDELKEYLDEKNRTLEDQLIQNQNLKMELNESLNKYEQESLKVKAEISKAHELFEIIKEKDSEVLNLKELLGLSEQAYAEIKQELDEAKSHDLDQKSVILEKESEILQQRSTIERLEITLQQRESEIVILNEKLTDGDAVDKMTLLEHRVEVLQSELKIVSQDKANFVLKCEELSDKLETECQEKEKTIVELNQSIFQRENELGSKIQQLEEVIMNFELSKVDLQAKCDSLTSELLKKTSTDEINSALKESFELKDCELTQTKAKLDDVENKLANAISKLSEVEEAYGQTEEKLEKYRIKVDDLLKANSELEKDKSYLKGKIFLGNKMLKRGESDRAALDSDYKTLKKDFDEMKTEKEKFEKLHKEVDNKQKDLDKQIRSLQKKVETLDMQNGVLNHENNTLKTELQQEKIEKLSIWKQLEEVSKPASKASCTSVKYDRNLRSKKVSDSSAIDSTVSVARGRERSNTETEPFSKMPKLNFDEREPIMTRSAHRRSSSAGSDELQLSLRKSSIQPSLLTTSQRYKPEQVTVKKENKPILGSKTSQSESSSTSILNPPKSFHCSGATSFGTAKKRPLHDKNKNVDNDDQECKVQ